ncbi:MULTISPECIES: hypothetical protein [unclassified Streptomyces]|uniref:hypothetical protein n=1 Tax=unclassified Streptomyces TaxID=2593676 RepID=UPI00336A116D
MTALLVVSTAGCSGGDKQPAANAGSAADSRATSTAQAAQARKYVAMAVDGRKHAMLAFQVHPEGGQLIGKYKLVSFDDWGSPFTQEKSDFNGRGSDSTFEFDGLTDYGAVTGILSQDRTRLTLNRDPGVGTKQWTIVSSANVFESAVKEYAKRFESCSKKKDHNPCVDVT